MDVVFTDLDGTLLDSHDYSYEGSMEAVRSLQSKNIPIVFCSSKTRAEQEFYRTKMDIHDPFIIEDGSAIMIPKRYFPSIDSSQYEQKDDYDVVVLGAGYGPVSRVTLLLEIRCDAKAFGKLPSSEVARLSGLRPDLAALAKKREYSETLSIEKSRLDRAFEIVDRHGLTMTYGGRFHTIKGKTDKGTAAKRLVDLFSREFGDIRSIGIGNSQNDIPLLEVVDAPFLIGKDDGHIDSGNHRFESADSFTEVVSEILA